MQANQAFAEAGLDSLGAVELRNGIQMQFNLDLPATVTFDYPSVNSLVDYIYGQMTLVAPLAKPSSSVPYSPVRSAYIMNKTCQMAHMWISCHKMSRVQVPK